MTLLLTLTFFIRLIHSLSCAHVFYEGFRISFKAQYLTECRAETDVFGRIVGEDLKHCIIECKLRPHCTGIGYRRRAGICDLFSSISDEDLASTGECIYVAKSDITETESPCEICSEGQVCDSNTNHCIYKECTRRSLSDGVVLGNTFNIGNTVSLKCNWRYSDLSGIKTATCQHNGTWTKYANCTSSVTHEPMTCSDVKHCNSAYTDGEYWLYSDVLGGRMVKIYCSEMSTQSPTEYISVNEYSNYGFDAGKENQEGVLTKFKKIRVLMQSMTIKRDDTAFRDPPDSILAYGVAKSCNCTNGCLPWRGYFMVSLEGTGLKFSDEAKWSAFGWNEGMTNFRRSPDNNVISARCGGYCGYCSPRPSNLNIVYNVNDGTY